MNCQLKLKPENLAALQRSDLMLKKTYLFKRKIPLPMVSFMSELLGVQFRLVEYIKLSSLFLCKISGGYNYKVRTNG